MYLFPGKWSSVNYPALFKKIKAYQVILEENKSVPEESIQGTLLFIH